MRNIPRNGHAPEAYDADSSFALVYGMMAVTGTLVGLLAGWLIWG